MASTLWWNGSGWQTTEVNCVYQSSGSVGDGGYVNFYTKISANSGGTVTLSAGLWAEKTGTRWANVGTSGTRVIKSNGNNLLSLYSGNNYGNAPIPETATISFSGTVNLTGYSGSWSTTGASINAHSQFTISSPYRTITVNAHGGTGAPSAQKVLYNQSTSLTSSTPTRANHTFLGWDTNKNSHTATYSAGGSISITSNTTLYAIWRPTVFISADEGVTITFNGTDYTNTTATINNLTWGNSYTLTIKANAGWIIKTRSHADGSVTLNADEITISATGQRVGCHIDDGNDFVQAVMYMDTGNDWQMIQAYVDDGNS